MPVIATVGLQLDGPILERFEPAVGTLRGSPSRLLVWLESQLGLSIPDVSHTSRALTYLECLRACDTPDRFYHSSLKVDPLGVAKKLLGWRDELYLAGWQGGAIAVAQGRLADIAEVERRVADRIAPCVGQRIQAVLAALSEHLPSVRITVLDPAQAFETMWRRLFEHLNAEFEGLQPALVAEDGSDLGALQQALLQAEAKPPALSDDGSFLVLRAPSRAMSSGWVSQYLQNLGKAHPDYSIGVLCDGGSGELDSALHAVGMPRLGTGEASVWRPVFQVLPLVMELLWEPLNPHKLLEFLTLPVGPLPRKLRSVLAEVVANEPGIGGPGWTQAVAKLLDEAASREDDPARALQVVEELSSSLILWLGQARVPESPGADIQLVSSRARALGNWLGRRLALEQSQEDKANERQLYWRAAGQINEFIAALAQLQAQGEEKIDAVTLRRLIRSVRGQGVARPDAISEISDSLGKCALATSPAACIGQVDTLIWWGADRGELARAPHWTASETRILAEAGVELLSADNRIDWQVAAWLRPCLAARKKLVMVVHDDAESHHPVFDYLRTRVKDIPEYALADVLQGQSMTHLDRVPTIIRAPGTPLPARQRVWQLPAGTAIPKRASESYSSLESFIYGPYMWVLRYAAKIRAGALLAVSDKNLLKGSLAHQMYEQFFTQHPDIASLDLDHAVSWGRDALNRLIGEAGTVMLLPGRTAERERFITDATRGLRALLSHLQQAEVITVSMERHVEGDFVGGAIGGFIDMVASKADGSSAVVDIKWGAARYRRESLRKDQYLQLAIYAQLLRQRDKRLPAVGYFVIATQDLLMLDSDFFPQADIVKAESGESILEFWQRFEKSWKARRRQLDDGKIEVNVAGTEIESELLFAEDALSHPEVFDSFNEFDALVGWEAQS